MKMMANMKAEHKGALYALAAFSMWGLAPIYFKYLSFVPETEILAYRIIWSSLITAGLITIFQDWGNVGRILTTPKSLFLLLGSAFFINVNWFVFIWAMGHDHMLDASLGYFINPIFNVLLGIIFFHEKLSRIKWLGVAFAFVGVLIQIIALGSLPWVSLVLPCSFAFYALLRKKVKVDAVIGLFIETALTLPFALYFIMAVASSDYVDMFNNSLSLNFWLVFAGIITAAPLICFGQAATYLKLSTLGFFQYLAPSLLFLFAIFIYGEALAPEKMASFVFIWAGVILFLFEKLIKKLLKSTG